MGNKSASPLLIFDFRNQDGTARPLCFAEPLEIVSAGSLAEVRPALRRVQTCVNAGLYAAGYVSYEAAPAFDSAFAVRAAAQMPLLWFAIFRAPSTCQTSPTDGDFRFTEWQPATRRDVYDRNVERVRAAIARGETYQTNYTLRLISRFEGDALACYRRLNALQRPPYAAYLDTGRYKVLSASPELFFQLRDGEIITRPMKGTIRRGRWEEEDDALAAQLSASEKDRAENVMIVDLLRNDLGRVADVGSVRVASLFDIERYPSVHQMTSTVKASVARDITLESIFAALFPCGSITGAPKVSTMRLIAALEDSAREVYCGAIGFMTPDGEAVFNVAIRTMTIDGATGEAAYGVGGGITWDSNADDEYREALVKAAQLLEDWSDFELLETLRLERGDYFLSELHLRRMRASADYFGFPFSHATARALLDRHARHAANATERVRLLLDRAGAFRVESEPLQPSPPAPRRVALAHAPVSSADRFLYHKTTKRHVYDERRAPHPHAYDVLLWNEREELTEFTNGNLVLEIEGQRWTPPRASGLLAGTFREHLLARGEIRERVLTPADFARASRLWFVNSVRGWIELEKGT